ncbi:hypothetical protein QJQ45_028375 [Haematococcus lacustris]|nr:hypothetical protein QJQ45_028375 [Haematococcus lacustris]
MQVQQLLRQLEQQRAQASLSHQQQQGEQQQGQQWKREQPPEIMLSPATASQEPGISTHQLVAACLPAALSAAGWSYSGSADGLDTNLLLLFHGLGDRHTPFAGLAAKLALPQTASLTLGGPLEVPESDGGRAWVVTHKEEGWEPTQLAARELMGDEFTLSPDMVLGTKAMEVKWLERELMGGEFTLSPDMVLGTKAMEVKWLESDLLMRVIKADVELGRRCQASWSAQFQLAARELTGGEFTLSPDMVLGTKAMEVKWLERTYNCLRNHHGNLDAVLISVPNKAHSMLGGNQEEVRRVMQFWARTLKVAPPVSGAVELSA